METYGTIISTPEGPSTRKFSFVINRDKLVRRGQFIQINTEEGILIGRVSDVFKTNRYFMRPESVKEYESSGKSMNEIFPVDNWEYLVAEVMPLGVWVENKFKSCSFPPSPGTKVIEPDPEILTNFFGLNGNGLHIGNLPFNNLSVKVDPTRLLQKHLAILAISGAGKSYLTSILIEELLNRKPEQGQLAVIVIDSHGEYTNFEDDPKYSAKTKVFLGSEIRIGLPNLSSNELAEFVPKLSSPQLRELTGLIRDLRKTNKNYGIKDLIQEIEEREQIKPATKDVLISILTDLASTGLFGVSDYPGLEDLARQGGLSVIDLSEMINLHKKQIIVTYIARKLFNARRVGLIPPFLLILEEAHQFAPEKAKKESAISKGIIQTIAREGRKFHASLCLISQRPIQLSTTALSQCNTHIILRVTNPYDLKHIGESSEGITSDVLKQISTLPVGSGLIVGEAVNSPLFIEIRKRESKESGKGLPLEKAAIEYYQKVKQKLEDAKSFM